ncbi:TIM-barrel domain-containing protein [Haliovirga abyssi]|uniref:Alpha-glucosidase n=1 Tax=Haliovirga abyssi TaxID=2996794 RepID=A0AAU9D4K5_9FUSO|nr:TIM-barrel domain-containing protein [Haliovirga abyssi]BDU50884.1 alpha-glucosidase [Haliovirga abyssi]
MYKKAEIIKNVELYKFGNPIKTDAVIISVDIEKFKLGNSIEGIELEKGDNSFKIKYNLDDSAKIYGLGEAVGSLNRRGKVYKTYATDDFDHTPGKEALYGAHPFLIIDNGTEKIGIFIDYSGEIIFDVAFSDKKILEIEISDLNFDMYIFKNSNYSEITKKYLELTGKSYVPPKWAFGYQQCRWSYPDSKTIKEVAGNFKKYDIPVDTIYMDIDYMKDFKVFTVDEGKFPDFKNFVKEIKDMGIKLIPIVDPGVKIESEYNVYEDGIENNYFCKNQNGEDFVAAVWPGKTHFPDFLNSKVRKWWGAQYKKLIDLGIEGFWNDMNEPAIFYTPEGLKKAFEKLNEISLKDDIGIYDMFALNEVMNSISNNRDDYKSFYHTLDNGEKILHDKVHNLFGFNMTRAASEGFDEINPDKRFLIFSRSSYAGMQRYGGIWYGDNKSWWEHILLSIKMAISVNLIGFLYSGADIGGFGENASAELLIRWSQAALFMPLYRNHSALGTRNQEPWAFDEGTREILREIIRIRYMFLPYIYSEYMKAINEKRGYINALFTKFNDENVYEIEDQFLVGENLMAAPIYEQNSTGRYVYLPETNWLQWNLSKEKLRDVKIIDKGYHYIKSKIEETAIFIKENSLVVIGEVQNFVGEKKEDSLTIIGFVEDRANYCYYNDDGVSKEYEKGEYIKIDIEIISKDNDYEIKISKEGNYKHNIREINFEIYNSKESWNKRIILK